MTKHGINGGDKGGEMMRRRRYNKQDNRKVDAERKIGRSLSRKGIRGHNEGEGAGGTWTKRGQVNGERWRVARI
jgi:hypothetical protein